METDFVIVNQHPQLLSYVDHLQRKNAESLSFYPLSCFEREIPKGRILLSLLNNEPCGYLYFGAMGGMVKVHQICIQFDLRRKLYGAILIGRLEQMVIKAESQGIILRCGFDLDANQFWKDLGYNCINVVDGGVRRMRKINIWQKSFQPMFALPTVEPSEGKTDASLWRRNKELGVVSGGMVRGKLMNQYRDLLIKRDLKSDV